MANTFRVKIRLLLYESHVAFLVLTLVLEFQIVDVHGISVGNA